MVQLDVRVVDDDGRFVRDLTSSDLQIFEDGQPEGISTFAMVDIPIGVVAPHATVPSDVATNTAASQGRLFVLVLDDLNTHPLRAVTVRDLAKYFVDHHLDESDRLALITTSGSREVSHEFTANRPRLHAVIDRFRGHSLAPAEDAMDAKQVFHNARSTLRSLKTLAAWLGDLADRRKAIVFLSEGIDFDIWNETLNPSGVMSLEASTIVGDMRELVTAATRANVSIYPVDARGLPGTPASTVKPIPTLVHEDRVSMAWVQKGQSLSELAAATGGVALVHSNAFDQAFDRIVEETSSYYLVGYTSSNTRRDGRFRRIEARSTRPGLKVTTRAGYASRNERRANRAPMTPVIETLQSPLSVSSGLKLKVAAVPFRGKGSKASVGVVVHAGGNDLQMAVTAGRFNGSIDVAIVAANADGQSKGSERGTLHLQLKPETRERVAEHGMRLLSHLDVPPGTYQLRVAVVDSGRALRGSVHYDLDVPDFSKAGLSLSGIVLTSEAVGAPLTGNVRFWEQLTPAPPTTAREFSAGDQVTAVTEVYTNGQKPGDRLDITTTVENERGTTFFVHEEKLSIDATKTAYRHTAPIHLPSIPAGSYVLKVRAQSSGAPERVALRQIPITIR